MEQGGLLLPAGIAAARRVRYGWVHGVPPLAGRHVGCIPQAGHVRGGDPAGPAPGRVERPRPEGADHHDRGWPGHVAGGVGRVQVRVFPARVRCWVPARPVRKRQTGGAEVEGDVANMPIPEVP